MRNSLKSRIARSSRSAVRSIKSYTRSTLREILDTDEDRVMNQYTGYLNFLRTGKKTFSRMVTSR